MTELVNEVSRGKWIVRGSLHLPPVLAWPPRSPDLSSYKIVLWGNIHTECYFSRYRSDEEINEAVTNASASINPAKSSAFINPANGFASINPAVPTPKLNANNCHKNCGTILILSSNCDQAVLEYKARLTHTYKY